MLERQFTHCMLRPGDLTPISDHTQVVGAFNPGAVDVDGQVMLMVRVVEAPVEERDGFAASPRFDDNGELRIDWFPVDRLDMSDPRKYIDKQTGQTRLRFLSYLKVLHSADGKTIDEIGGLDTHAKACSAGVVMPRGVYEEYGIEDPRITRIGETFYVTYVAVSRHGVATCLMSTTDFARFTRHGIIFCPENKDVLLFPEKIMGDYAALHRPVPDMQFLPPEIWLARSPDLIHWGAHEQLLGSEIGWQESRMGGGTPPIRTREGWLLFYHGSARARNQAVGTYAAGLLLLDLENPSKVLGYSEQPVMAPQADFEMGGYVANVVFPTGVVERDDLLYVYYGAADTNTGVVGFKRQDALAALARRGR